MAIIPLSVNIWGQDPLVCGVWSGLRGNYPRSEHWWGDEREDGETDKITGPHRSCVRSEGRQSRAIVMKTEHCWALVDRSEVCRIFAQIEMLTTDLTHQKFWFVLWLKDKPRKHAKLDLLWTERRKSQVWSYKIKMDSFSCTGTINTNHSPVLLIGSQLSFCFISPDLLWNDFTPRAPAQTGKIIYQTMDWEKLNQS